jgi:uncharacterized protein YceH (UPF0502 family)
MLQFTPQERAIVCELLVRGPQTPGELRSRAARMAEFTDVSQVEAALEALSTREGGPMVQKLAREPGRRDSRFAHLFSGPITETAPVEPAAVHASAGASSAPGAPLPASVLERLSVLEDEVRQLREQLTQLRLTPKA